MSDVFQWNRIDLGFTKRTGDNKSWT